VTETTDPDFQTLALLEKQAGRTAVVKLLGNHRQNVTQTIAELEKITGNIDRDHIHMIAHRMQGSCGSLGFHRLSALFSDMDKAVMDGNHEQVIKYIQEVVHENEILADGVRQYYPEILSKPESSG